MGITYRKTCFDAVSKYAYKIFSNIFFMLAQVAVALWCHTNNQIEIMLHVFLALLLVELLFCRDLSPTLLPVMLISLVLMTQYGKFVDDYMQFLIYAAAYIVLFGLRFLLYPVRNVKGRMYWPLLAVSIALITGGIGSISAADYFEPMTLYYVFGLGFGVMAGYYMFRNYLLYDRDYDLVKSICNVMLCVGLMAVFMVYPVAIKGIVEGSNWYVQWKNNVSTFLLLSMPFAFYMSLRRPHGFLYLLFAVVQYGAIMLIMSRGGMISGSIIFVFCLIASIILSNRLNKIFSIFILLALIGSLVYLFVFNTEFLEELKNILAVDADESRVGLYQEAIRNFFENPLFGAGMGDKLDRYDPAKGAGNWYHSTIFQVIGSMGIVGIIAYAYQFIMRCKVIMSGRSTVSVFIMMSFLAFQAMALVNPGDFVPIPYGMVLIGLIAIGEKLGESAVKPIDRLSISAYKREYNVMFKG